MSDGSKRSGPGRGRWTALLALVVGCAVAAVLGTVATERWARDSRGFCVSCHADVRSHAPGHRDAPCQSCHATTAAERLTLAAARWRGARPTGRHATARAAQCAACHTPAAPFATSAGHTSHGPRVMQGDCVRCHGRSLHGNLSAHEACTTCHATIPMLSEPRGENACVLCHEFSQHSPDAATTVRVGVTDPAASRITASNVHGAVDCRECHNPHRATPVAGTPGALNCARCHRGMIAAQVAAGPAGHQTCTGCHNVHADRHNGAVQCERCHTAPHREPPTRTNPTGARQGRRVTNAIRAWSTAQGTALPSAAAPATPVVVAHNPTWTHKGRCASCHRPHTWTAQPSDCRGCHTQQATSLVPDSPHGRNDCVSCHDPHGPRPNATVCAGCHTPQGRMAAGGTPSGHAQCTACHNPHAPARPTADTCGNCHRAQHARVEHGPVQHTNCVSCHQPHGQSAAQTPTTCANCHRAEANYFSANAVPPMHRRCQSCHADHNFSRQAARTTCVRCHSDLASHRGSHRGDCVTCHSPHTPIPGPVLTACTSCHTTIQIGGPPAAHAGHSNCAGCHQPHRAATAAATGCVRCHASEWNASRTWPTNSPHGGDCRQCHGPHFDRPRPECGSCHAAQNNANHRGVHTQCTQCHAPHREFPAGGGAAWWSRCADCHRTEAEAARASTTTATHRQCANCHQRPGLRPPTCATCHTAIPGTLLHATPQHNTCTSCHERHGNAPPTRPQCVACHTDRAGHFPDAPRCQSCHPFSPSGGRGP